MLSLWVSGLVLAVQAAPALRSVPVITPAPLATARAPAFPNPPVATRSLPTYFNSADYPAEALRSRQEGLVAITVAIDQNGRIDGCTVSHSSASPSLDAATCSIIQRRARFWPARDAAGKTIRGTSTARIRWALPVAPLLPFASRSDRLVYVVDARGSLGACRLESSSDAWQSALRSCEVRKAGAARALRTFAPNGEANSRELVIDDGALVGGTIVAPNTGSRPDEKILFHVAVTLSADSSGRITSCAPAPGDTHRSITELACTEIAQRRFAALVTDGRAQPERRLTIYRTGYTRPPR